VAAAQKRRRILIAAIAGIVALGAFALVFTQIGTARNSAPPAATVATNTSKAVVALIDVNVGDQLSAANIAITDFPVSALPAAGLYYPDTATLLAAPWYSTVKLPKGQLLLATQLSQQLAPQKLPPVQLTDGDVAMSVPYDESKDAAGFIQQDDYIDILVDDPSSKTVHYAFQGIHVLRVGDRSAQPTAAVAASPGAAPPAAGATVLLIEVQREQAAALAFAIDGNYTIRYLIRPHNQQTQTALPNSDPVGQSNWLSVISS
jgi:Flp pilus assembly protein CpaB